MSEPGASRPNPMWAASASALLAVAVTLGVVAFLYQRDASRPVGEGELFADEARQAAAVWDAERRSGSAPEVAARRVRNQLRIEAVSVVDSEGTTVASTSPNQVGVPVDPFLAGLLSRDRFGALAVPLTRPLLLDGIAEHPSGEVVYQVAEPVGDGSGLILSYDMSELLARRERAAGIRPLTLQLGGAGLAAAALSVALWWGRAGAIRRIREAELEACMLAERSRELERHNREIDEARREAERALALAEETNRIRTEFVLMINHELRTPLTGVVTGAELLLDQPDLPAEQRTEILSDLARDGHRLQELISQILAVARIENRGLAFTLTEVDTDEIWRRLRGMGSGVRVESGPVELGVRTDPDALTQLLRSLADNALTHGASTVTVRYVEDLPFEPQLVVGDVPEAAGYFCVADDGPGIEPDFLPRAFEKFEKRGFASGTGLGLYLARMTAEAIEGCIAVATGPDGTTMAVGVPQVTERAQRVAS